MSYYTDLDNDLGADSEAAEWIRERRRLDRAEKANFQAAVSAAVRLEIQKMGAKAPSVSATKSYPRGAMVTVKCGHCKIEFQARMADRKRGWGRFCSKSCKAKAQF